MKNKTEITNNVLLYLNVKKMKKKMKKRMKSTNNWYWAICVEHLNFVVLVHSAMLLFLCCCSCYINAYTSSIFSFISFSLSPSVTFPFYASNSIYSDWSMCEKRDTRFYSLNFIVRKMLIHKMQQQVKIKKAWQRAHWKRALPAL